MRAAWKAILAAAVGGAATAASDALMFDGTTHPKQLAVKAAIGATVAVAGYLKQSPIKPEAPPPEK
jgi:hypothetical protein